MSKSKHIVPPPPHKEGELDFYVVYEKPTDYPDHWVVRRHTMKRVDRVMQTIPADNITAAGADLDEVRRHIPRHCDNIGRLPQDDPKIYEVWI